MAILRTAWMPERFRTTRHPFSTRITIAAVVAIIILFAVVSRSKHIKYLYLTDSDPTPLIDQYIDHGDGGKLGRWYMPEEWLHASSDPNDHSDHASAIPDATSSIPVPKHPVEVAQLALELAVRDRHFIKNTNIPLIVHQMWQDFDSSHYSLVLKQCIEKWLSAATGKIFTDTPQNFTYILWSHEAADWFMSRYEPELYPYYQRFPAQVERSDVFRVAIQKWFGGIYADTDAMPIRHPYNWVKESDVAEWTDPETGLRFQPYEPAEVPYATGGVARERPFDSETENSALGPSPGLHLGPYSSTLQMYTGAAPESINTPIGAIVGIECDTPPKGDNWWRFGYSYPVQLTNWAFAFAPHHPITYRYLDYMKLNMDRHNAGLIEVSPIDLTGPPAFTTVVKHFAEVNTRPVNPKQSAEGDDPKRFEWESVTGVGGPKGGRGKTVAGDIMVMPITGFSPGRSWRNNYGSEPIEHPEARIYHFAAGSWRKWRLSAELEKACRSVMGRCRKNFKFPEPA